jgi:putative transposase
MAGSRRFKTNKNQKKEKKAKLGSSKKRCSAESRSKAIRQSQEFWSENECGVVRNQRDENNPKKKDLRYREINREERIEYYRNLRELIKKYGSKSLVFIDESGFEENVECVYAWSERGKKVYGEKQGKRGKRENLVAGRRKKKKEFIAPMIFTGSLDATGFEGWLNLFLIPSLATVSVLIMDNAPIHRKNKIRELVEAAGHQVLFLPRYSPDLNDIEHDFGAVKRSRMYAKPGTSIDEIIRDYCTA